MLSDDHLNEVNVARLQQYYEDARARIRAVTDLAVLWLKSMILLAGGGIVGLFTLLGNVGELTVQPRPLWFAFALLVASLVSSMTSLFCGYLGQDAFYDAEFTTAENIYKAVTHLEGAKDPTNAWAEGKRWHLPALAFAVLALACFTVGCGFALSAVRP